MSNSVEYSCVCVFCVCVYVCAECGQIGCAVNAAQTGQAHGLEIRKDIIEFAEANLKRLREVTSIDLPQYVFLSPSLPFVFFI